MREIHELQEERLMLSQVKAKTAMEKVHAKSLKKAIKTGNVEQVEQANRQEYQKLAREHDDKVPQSHSAWVVLIVVDPVLQQSYGLLAYGHVTVILIVA